MITLWYPNNKDKCIVSKELKLWLKDKQLFHQQVQDWINSRFPSFNQSKVFLNDDFTLVDTTCSICLEESKYQAKCGHFFHEHCIAKWIEKNPTCPLCRCEL
jgi:hypothetical protein